MFLTLKKFLSFFPEKEISKENFYKQFKVMYKTPITLEELFTTENNIIKSKSDIRYKRKNEIINYLYDFIITNKHKYLSLWFSAHFEVISPLKLNWESPDLFLDNEDNIKLISIQKNDASKRMIRSMFYKELFDTTIITNTVKSRVSFWQSLLNMYNKLELEDRFFCVSSVELLLREKNNKRELKTGIKEVNYNIFFYLYQQYQPKASIFNPYSIKWILENIFITKFEKQNKRKPKTLFSPVLSWGSYLCAFMHIKCLETYHGVDVMPKVCKKIEKYGKWYNKTLKTNKNIKIICKPSESLHKSNYEEEHNKFFDLIIICPPYYNMEIYPEGKQSTTLYKTYDIWLKEYWENTVKLCRNLISKNGVFGVISNNYYTLEKEMFPLVSDLNEITTKYFKFNSVYFLQNRTSPLRVNSKDRMERLNIYFPK
jgi:hypothetical protein